MQSMERGSYQRPGDRTKQMKVESVVTVNPSQSSVQDQAGQGPSYSDGPCMVLSALIFTALGPLNQFPTVTPTSHKLNLTESRLPPPP